MNRAQRIVLVIALGIGLVALAGALNLVLLDRYPDWFAYAPNTGVTTQTDTYFVVSDDESILRQAGIWLGALAIWVGASLWLLRSRPEAESS